MLKEDELIRRYLKANIKGCKAALAKFLAAEKHLDDCCVFGAMAILVGTSEKVKEAALELKELENEIRLSHFDINLN